MIPPTGPNLATGSRRAEPDIYWRLQKQLPDEFTVIHSIPWLSSVARAIDGRPVPTGEIDFLILHPELGLLAIEVKGGVLAYDRTEFVYLRTGERLDPVRQVRRGTHGLENWLKAQGNSAVKIGYALLLPDSEVKGRPLPPALFDPTVSPPREIAMDRPDLHELGEKVQGVMRYWRQTLNARPLGAARVQKLVDLICPEADYSPSWLGRIEFDEKEWLKLSLEQTESLNAAVRATRSVITGWPGTGKTLLAISLARRLHRENQSALFLVYNTLLAKALSTQLSDSRKVKVMQFHALCRQAARALGKAVPTAGAQGATDVWYRDEAPLLLRQAVQQGALPQYEALILDEAQVFEQEWLRTLTGWMGERRIAAFCDETQVFEFEKKTTVAEICSIIGALSPFTLTVNKRSPHAVFERLQQALDSPYQHHNPRPDEPDTLQELAVDDPASTLGEVLERLKAEKVPSNAVMILFHKARPWNDVIPPDYPVTMESIARFRGLESPVVIIYAPHSIDDVPLFCAYSRATSRCIVIYNAYEVTKGTCGNFGKLLLESGQEPDIRAAAALGSTTGIIDKLGLSVERIVSRAGHVGWCRDWGAWLIPPDDGAGVTSALWLDYLSLVTDRLIYCWDYRSRGSLLRGKARLELTDGLDLEEMILAGCNICKCLTPHTMKLGAPDVCALCVSTDYLPSGEPPEGKDLSGCDTMLASSEKVPANVKRQYPPPIIALGWWNTLPDDNQAKLVQAILNVGGSVGYRAALVFSGIEIIKTEPGKELVLDSMAKKYYSWSTWMSERLSPTKWREIVALALSRWKQRGLIGSKSKGVFYRL